jgi:hypothetical protein
MDSSSREAFILGQLDIRVAADEMTPRQWVGILEKVIKKARSHLKYIPEFKPFAESAGVVLSEKIPTESNLEKVVVSNNTEDIGWKTKGLLVHMLEVKKSQLMLEVNNGFRQVQRIPMRISMDRIFLTNKGKFVLWKADFQAEKIRNEGDASYYSARYALSESRFEELQAREVALFIEEDIAFVVKFLKTIFGGIEQYCVETKNRLKEISSIKEEIFGIVNRVKWPEEKK